MKLCLFYNVVLQLIRESGESLESVLGYLKSIGIDAVEPQIGLGETGGDCAGFRAKMEACGISVPACSSFVPMYKPSDLDGGRRFINDAVILGAKNALLLPMPVPEDAPWDQVRDNMAEQLTVLAEYSDERGISLSLENFSRPPYPFTFTEDHVYLLENVTKLHMTFDTGNFIWVNESPSEAFDRIAGIRQMPFSHVHMKNYSASQYNSNPNPAGHDLDGNEFWSYPTVDGGLSDIGYICQRLKEIGYDGTVSIENGGIVPARDALEASVRYLSEKLF